MNKFDRVLSILVLLQTKKIIKASTISDRFDVSMRTVYRDISTLKNAGIPIIGDPGVGYSIMNGYRLPPVMFTEGETAALLTAEKFIGKITDQETENHYENAMMKIRAILRSSENHSLSLLDDSIAISDNNSLENNAYLPMIFKSITSKSILDIEYHKVDGSVSNRLVEPIGCYHQFNKWYLVGYCQLKNDYRTFKINRIVNLKSLHQHYETEHISLQKYIDQQNEAWKENQQFHSIEIAFDKSLVEFAENRKYYFGFVDQKEIDNRVHMTFLNSSLEIIARWLLQFGDKATVIEPKVLKERMHVIAIQLYNHYT